MYTYMAVRGRAYQMASVFQCLEAEELPGSLHHRTVNLNAVDDAAGGEGMEEVDDGSSCLQARQEYPGRIRYLQLFDLMLNEQRRHL